MQLPNNLMTIDLFLVNDLLTNDLMTFLLYLKENPIIL